MVLQDFTRRELSKTLTIYVYILYIYILNEESYAIKYKRVYR